MATLSDIMAMLKTLSEEDLMKLKRSLLDTPNTAKTLAEYTEELRFVNGRVCPICGCIHVVRNGHRKDGTQCFLCRGCSHSFVITANAITAGTRKKIDVWQKYIDCMMSGFSIRKSAEICEISKNTSFNWRHKILDALQNMQADILLNGIVEADETFFPVSYKGNHKNSKTFKMPREAHHRGKSVHKRGLSAEQVCVLCAVNRSGQSYVKVGKLGKVSQRCVSVVFDKHIKEHATLCTDGEKAYRRFSIDKHLKLVQLDTKKSKSGIYHIQHINNYHSMLKKFLEPFNGVSTKYLNNYLVWYNLVKFAKETSAEKASIFFDFVLTTVKSVHCRELPKRENLPLLAA